MYLNRAHVMVPEIRRFFSPRVLPWAGQGENLTSGRLPLLRSMRPGRLQGLNLGKITKTVLWETRCQDFLHKTCQNPARLPVLLRRTTISPEHWIRCRLI